MVDEDLRPEQGPPAPEDPPLEPVDDIDEDDENSAPLHMIDPAFAYIVLSIIVLLGLNSLIPEVRFSLIWAVLALVAVAGLALDRDKVPVEPLTFRQIIIGIGLGAVIALPVVGVGSAELARISHDIFGSASDAFVFQVLFFAMPLAETLFFRLLMQSARGAIFTGIMAGIWAVLLFLPRLNLLKFPLVAIVISAAFVFINFFYSYIRHRFGLYASWACQVVMGLLLLFVSRFIAF